MVIRNIFLSILITASSLIAQTVGVWSGSAAIENDKRIFTIEISKKENNYLMNWSLSGANIYIMPSGEIYYRPDDSLSASLFMFNHPVGKIEGKFSNEIFSGNLSWNKNKMPVVLNKINNYKLPFREEEYIINNKDVSLSGTFVLPNGSGPFPAVVFLHGSGPAERWWAMSYAKEFAEIGIASFLYDKRGCGKSTGSWISSSLDDLTGDVSSVINFLKTKKEINPNKIGVYAVSQSGWVTSRLAVSDTPPAFAIVNSGGGATPYEVEILFYKKSLEHSSLNISEKEEAMKLAENYLEYLKTGNNRELLIEKIAVSKVKNWYKFINIERVLPSDKNRKNWEWVPTYNPVTDIKKINFPILILMGKDDDLIPVETAISKWKTGLNSAQNKNYEIKVFENAGHALRMGGHESFNSFPRYAEGSLEYQINWLKKNILN